MLCSVVFVFEQKRQVVIEQTRFLSTVFLCRDRVREYFTLESIFSGIVSHLLRACDEQIEIFLALYNERDFLSFICGSFLQTCRPYEYI